jgi:hypothetical protein
MLIIEKSIKAGLSAYGVVGHVLLVSLSLSPNKLFHRKESSPEPNSLKRFLLGSFVAPTAVNWTAVEGEHDE